jgi:hypothetical protein
MLCSTVKITYVSEEHIIFRAEVQAKHKTSLKHWSGFCLLHAGFLFGLHFNPEDGGDIFLPNVSWITPEYTMLHSRRDIFLIYLFAAYLMTRPVTQTFASNVRMIVN